MENIKDSGDRTVFSSGAVRDMHQGKGRCDLLPMDIVAEIYTGEKHFYVFDSLNGFLLTGKEEYLWCALRSFVGLVYEGRETMLLELSRHFEDGCEKYGENNWRKGIEVHSYLDSAIRHLFKFLRGDEDERHDRAFCWNIICAIWTIRNKPEMMDIPHKENKND